MSSARRSSLLIALGAILFTVGLITGFAVPAFLNPRMGLTAHLEGVMNGIFLLAIGAVWQRVRLPGQAEAGAFWLLVYGSFANWASVLLAAVFGTSSGTPIAGAGFTGATRLGATGGDHHMRADLSRRPTAGGVV